MRVSQVYRWQIPMDAGVVLRERRLKPATGCSSACRRGTRRLGRNFSPAGIQCRDAGRGANGAVSVGTGLARRRRAAASTQPSVAFGISCAQAELGGELPQAADYRAAPLCSGDPDELFARLAAMPGEKVAKVKVGLWEAVRDGMVVNLLLEAIPDLQLRLDANRAGRRSKRNSSPNTLIRRTASALLFLKNLAKRGRILGPLAARQDRYRPDESLREADFRFVAEPGCVRW
nr:o-succinylbenzoate synthase [Klebsiella pneumoniae]